MMHWVALYYVGLGSLAQTTDARPQRLSSLVDEIRIDSDVAVVPGAYHVRDVGGDGAIHVVGDDITVDFAGAVLDGAEARQSPDTYSGTGIVIRGRKVRIRNVVVRGYRVGICAVGAPGLIIEDADVSGNYRERLASTPDAEDAADWLFPHENDDRQWVTQHGAGLCVERSSGVTLRRIRARRGQNGIVLDRVENSQIYDCDCSFLSGWGLALWRSSRNTIAHNAFDFCVRGYSHGVYNRGQDSAGILIFEQCNDNIIVENSATHCGDGLFGFGGNASLEGTGRTGNNGNLLFGNDFSYAAAHGIEMTFSFDNRIAMNRLVSNAICGVWAGYSQDTEIYLNAIENNGDAGYGLERGGINIEHGYGNVIRNNRFRGNACGIHLWSDEDAGLMEKPWVRANHKGSAKNTIVQNQFLRDRVGLHLRRTTNTILMGNVFTGVPRQIDADDESRPAGLAGGAEGERPVSHLNVPRRYAAPGRMRPVGARSALAGREHIVMTQWGPYDYTNYLVVPNRVVSGRCATAQVLGPKGEFRVTDVDGNVSVEPMRGSLPGRVRICSAADGLQSFRLGITAEQTPLTVAGSLFAAEWSVRFYQWGAADDPREHEDLWTAMIDGSPTADVRAPEIDFTWATGSPAENVRADYFGTVATTTVTLPEGRYRVHTVSDDGIRVWLDGRRIIDDWTWHPPKTNDAEVNVETGEHTFRIEHFEINGYARLAFTLHPLQ